MLLETLLRTKGAEAESSRSPISKSMGLIHRQDVSTSRSLCHPITVWVLFLNLASQSFSLPHLSLRPLVSLSPLPCLHFLFNSHQAFSPMAQGHHQRSILCPRLTQGHLTQLFIFLLVTLSRLPVLLGFSFPPTDAAFSSPGWFLLP